MFPRHDPQYRRPVFHTGEFLVWGIAIALWLWWVIPILSSSLWLDEFATWWIAHRSFFESVFHTSPYPPHPSYYGLMHLVIALFGDSEVILRMPSVLLFLHSCFLLSRIAPRLLPQLPPRSLAIATFFVMMMSPLLIKLFLQARPYSLGIWASLLSFHLLFQFGMSRSLPWLILGVILASLVALGAHISFMVILPIQASIFWVIRSESDSPPNWITLIALQSIVVIVIAAVLYGAGAFQPSLSVDGFEAVRTDVSALAFIQHTVRNYPLKAIFLLGLVIAASLPLTIESFRKNHLRHAVVLITWTVLPHLVLAIGSIVTGKLLYERYACLGAMTTPILYAGVAAFLLSKIARLSPKVILVIATALLGFCAFDRPLSGFTEEWREMASWIRDRADSPRVIILKPGHLQSDQVRDRTSHEQSAWLAPLEYYHRDTRDSLYLYQDRTVTESEKWPIKGQVPSDSSSVFFLCRSAHFSQSCKDIAERFASGKEYDLIESDHRMNMGVYHWKKKGEE